jgi:hypothetical protein
MSNLWRLKQTVLFDKAESTTWPALLEAEFELEPSDFFERNENTVAKTSFSGEAEIEINSITGKMRIKKTGLAPALVHKITLPDGTIEITGNKAIVKVKVTDAALVAAYLDWIQVVFSQSLTVQLGIYCSAYFIRGTISEKKFSLAYNADVYSLRINNTEPSKRAALIDQAFNLIDSKSPSYQRFVTCCLYFHHALRLMSPYQVEFPPYVVLSEVLLNLSKCVELLFSCSNRDQLRKQLSNLGYDKEQYESQIISIFFVRNEIDVGHSISGIVDSNEIATLRKFADRAVINVKAVLVLVSQRIAENPHFLAPISTESSKDVKKLIKKLSAYLDHPALD